MKAFQIYFIDSRTKLVPSSQESDNDVC